MSTATSGASQLRDATHAASPARQHPPQALSDRSRKRQLTDPGGNSNASGIHSDNQEPAKRRLPLPPTRRHSVRLKEAALGELNGSSAKYMSWYTAIIEAPAVSKAKAKTKAPLKTCGPKMPTMGNNSGTRPSPYAREDANALFKIARWTEEEDEILRRHQAELSTDYTLMQEQLRELDRAKNLPVVDRTISAISIRMYMLKFGKPRRHAGPIHVWDRSDDPMVRDTLRRKLSKQDAVREVAWKSGASSAICERRWWVLRERMVAAGEISDSEVMEARSSREETNADVPIAPDDQENSTGEEEEPDTSFGMEVDEDAEATMTATPCVASDTVGTPHVIEIEPESETQSTFNNGVDRARAVGDAPAPVILPARPTPPSVSGMAQLGRGLLVLDRSTGTESQTSASSSPSPSATFASTEVLSHPVTPEASPSVQRPPMSRPAASVAPLPADGSHANTSANSFALARMASISGPQALMSTTPASFQEVEPLTQSTTPTPHVASPPQAVPSTSPEDVARERERASIQATILMHMGRIVEMEQEKHAEAQRQRELVAQQAEVERQRDADAAEKNAVVEALTNQLQELRSEYSRLATELASVSCVSDALEAQETALEAALQESDIDCLRLHIRLQEMARRRKESEKDRLSQLATDAQVHARESAVQLKLLSDMCALATAAALSSTRDLTQYKTVQAEGLLTITPERDTDQRALATLRAEAATKRWKTEKLDTRTATQLGETEAQLRQLHSAVEAEQASRTQQYEALLASIRTALAVDDQ